MPVPSVEMSGLDVLGSVCLLMKAANERPPIALPRDAKNVNHRIQGGCNLYIAHHMPTENFGQPEDIFGLRSCETYQI